MKYLFVLYLSIYQSPSDPTKSVVECSYDEGKPDLLIVDTSKLESKFVEAWVLKTCKEIR